MDRYVAVAPSRRPDSSAERAALVANGDGFVAWCAADIIVADDAEPVNTGLVNAQGQALWRIAERPPVGFRITS